jgi:hypothetical protein
MAVPPRLTGRTPLDRAGGTLTQDGGCDLLATAARWACLGPVCLVRA